MEVKMSKPQQQTYVDLPTSTCFVWEKDEEEGREVVYMKTQGKVDYVRLHDGYTNSCGVGFRQCTDNVRVIRGAFIQDGAS